LQALVPDIQFPLKVQFSVDGPVLGFSLLTATLAAVFCGAWNGVAARWQGTMLAMRGEMSTSSASRGGARLRGVFIAVQIALTFLLLSSAGLFYRSVGRAREGDLGFDARFLSVVRVDLSGSRYTPAECAALLRTLRSSLSNVAGIQSVSMATSVPLGFDDHNRIRVLPEGQAVERPVWSNSVSPDYFASMGIPLLGGRDFTDLDRAESGRVAIVNEALARKLWNSSLPLGSVFVTGGERYQVVGVVRDTKVWSLTQESQPYLYLPLWQSFSTEVAIHVKSWQRPGSVYRLVESQLAKRDASLPVVSSQTMSQQVDAAVFPQHIALVMLSVFSLVGIYLAAVGLYGVIAHAARSRTREIAIRMAIGASSGEICRMVTRQTVKLVAVGLCAGAALAAASSSMLGAVLFGAGGIDLVSLAGAAAMIALVAILATSVPTLHAMRVQAATALRSE
jgi:predicted permease